MLRGSSVRETLKFILSMALEGRYYNPHCKSGTSKIPKLNTLSQITQPVSVKARTETLLCLTLGPVLFHELACCCAGEYWRAGQGEEGDPALGK